MRLLFDDAIDVPPRAGLDLARHAPAASHRFAARLHTDLARLEPVWRTLERHGACSAYQQFDWVHAIEKHLVPAGGQPVFVELRDAETGRALMIWPLLRRRHLGLTTITWLSCGVCDYAAPLMAEGLHLSPGEARAAWAAVRKVLPPADLIRIDEVPTRVHGVPNPIASLADLQPSSHDTFGTPIDGDPATILERVCSASMQREMAMRRRRLAKRGEVRFEVADTPEAVEALFAILLEQRLARFAKLGRFDLLARPAAAAFYREAALAGLRGGGARLLGLRVGQEWVATCYGLVHDGAFHISLLSIADESWRNCSPGMLLVTDCMRWSRQQGLSYFDFTIGDHSYKSKIGGRPSPLMELVEPLTAAGRMLVWAQRGMQKSKDWLKSQPELFDNLRRLRQSLRRSFAGAIVPDCGATASNPNAPPLADQPTGMSGAAG